MDPKNLWAKHRNSLVPILVYGAGFLLCAWIISIVIAHRQPFDSNVYWAGAKVDRSGSTFDNKTLVQSALAKANAMRSSSQTPYPFGSAALIAIIFYPLSFLSIETSYLLITATSLILLTIAARRISARYWPLIIAAFLCSYPIAFEMELGNWQPITTALIALAICDLRDKKSTRAGILIGIAGAFKLFPLFLFLPLSIRKDWKAIKSMTISFCALWIACIPILGVKDFIHDTVASVKPHGTSTFLISNAGIPGSLQYVTHSGALAILAFLGCIAISAWILFRFRAVPTYLLAAGATLMMFLTSPVIWTHSTSLLMVAFCFMVSKNRVRRSMLWIPIGLLLAAQWIPFATLGVPLRNLDYWAKGLRVMRWFPLATTLLALLLWARSELTDETVGTQQNS